MVDFTFVSIKSTGYNPKVHRMRELTAIRVSVSPVKIAENKLHGTCTLKEWFSCTIKPELVEQPDDPYLLFAPVDPEDDLGRSHSSLNSLKSKAESMNWSRKPMWFDMWFMGPIPQCDFGNLPITDYRNAWTSLYKLLESSYWVASNPVPELAFFERYLMAMRAQAPLMSSRVPIDIMSMALPMIISGECDNLWQEHVAEKMSLQASEKSTLAAAYQALQIFCEIHTLQEDFPGWLQLIADIPRET